MTLGIRGTLALGLAGLLFAAGAIAAWVVITVTADETLRQVARQLERRADGLAQFVSSSPADRAALGAWLTRQRTGDLVGAAVFDEALKPIAGAGQAADTPAVGDALQGEPGPGRRVTRGAEHPRGAGLDFRVARRVSVGGQRAALGLVFSMDGPREAVASRQRLVLSLLAFDVVALLLFGLYLATRTLVRPVRALTAATQAIAAGDGGAEQVPHLRGPAELQGLAEAFRAMITRLAAQHAELQGTIEQLEAARDGLVRSEKLATVGRLAAGVAHEVGNPLAAVMGYVEYLQTGRADEALRGELLGRTRKELERMRGIVRQLLDVARPSPAAPARVDLGDIARSAAEIAGYHAALRQVQVAVVGQAPAVWADPAQLRQVFVNLLLNAGQAQGGVGEVTVTLSGDGAGGATAVVQDAGPGIPADMADQLFEPFVTGRTEGTGLGLAICLRVVTTAGGGLRLLSAPGAPGAAFEVWLPGAAGPAEPVDAPAGEPPSGEPPPG